MLNSLKATKFMFLENFFDRMSLPGDNNLVACRS
jgi:hypothetical protein